MILIVDSNFANSSEQNTYPSLRSLKDIAKPGDIIEVRSQLDEDEITFKGKLDNPIIISGAFLISKLVIKSQYLGLMIDCNELYIMDSIGILVSNAKYHNIYSHNVAFITIYNVKAGQIKFDGGTKIDIVNSSVKILKMIRCDHYKVSDDRHE